MPSRTRVISTLTGLRPSELHRVLPIAGVYAIILVTVYVLKPVRNSLFLSTVGVRYLPVVIVTVALAGAGAAAVIAQSTRTLHPRRLMTGVLTAGVVSLIGAWLVLRSARPALVFGFYVWVSLYATFAASTLWLLANASFDARESRRVFGFIGAFGIVGAVIGGVLTHEIVEALGTLNLLPLCAGLLATCFPMLHRSQIAPIRGHLRDRHRRASPDKEPSAGTSANVPLVQALALLAALTGLVSSIVDVQFNVLVDASFDTADEKTAFFGEFFAYLNVGAFLFQIFATPRILRGSGLTIALSLLPLAVLIGSMGVLVLPTLATASAIKAADGGLRHSIHKAATEILFVPIPDSVKRRSKLLLDATMDNLGSGLGALIVWIAAQGFGLEYRYLGILSGAVVILWLVGISRTRAAYVDAFRHALERRVIDPEQIRVEISDGASVAPLLSALNSDNPRQLDFALGALESVRSPSVVAAVTPLIGHESAVVRARAVALLGTQDAAGLAERVSRLLGDASQSVRAAAVYFLCIHGSRPEAEELGAFLAHPDGQVRAAALECIPGHFESLAATLLTEARVSALLATSEPGGTLIRQALARAIGAAGRVELRSHLERLAADDCPEVVTEAIASIGRSRDPAWLPWLEAQLSDRRYRRHAREALRMFGDAGVRRLAESLGQNSPIRAQIPRVLAGLNSQLAVDALLDHLEVTPPCSRFASIKALSKLRARAPQLRFGRARIRRYILEELRYYDELSFAMAWVKPRMQDSVALGLLGRALNEKQLEALERVSRLLGLVYPQRDIYNAFVGLSTGDRRTRASALEFIDQVLEPGLRGNIVAAVERFLAQASEPMLTRLPSPIGRLVADPDPWIRACALFALAPPLQGELLETVRSAQRDSNPIVAQTARLVLSRVDGGSRC